MQNASLGQLQITKEKSSPTLQLALALVFLIWTPELWQKVCYSSRYARALSTCGISTTVCSKVRRDEREISPVETGSQAGSCTVRGSNAAAACGLRWRLQRVKRLTCPSGFKVCLQCRGMWYIHRRRKKIHL